MGVPGLLVQPYHRILSAGPSLDEAEQSSRRASDRARAGRGRRRRRGSRASRAPYAFALAWPGKGALVAESLPGSETLLDAAAPPSLRALDTYFLHHAVLGPLLGVPDEAVSYVHSLKRSRAGAREQEPAGSRS